MTEEEKEAQRARQQQVRQLWQSAGVKDIKGVENLIQEMKKILIEDMYQAELDTLQNRGYTTAFFNGIPDSAAQNYETTQSRGDWRNAGVISAWTPEGAEMILYQKIEAGDTLWFLPPDRFESVPVVLPRIIDGFTEKEVPVLSPGRVGQSVFIPKSFFKGLTPENLPVFTVSRIKPKS